QNTGVQNKQVSVAQTPNASQEQTVLTPDGPRVLKVIFKESQQNGSFDKPSADGTAANSGLLAKRLFNPDGTLLSQDPTSPGWPKWLNTIEIGISGKNNLSADNADCARFATAEESTNTQCGSDTAQFACGAPSKFYRISEYDCAKQSQYKNAPSTQIGNGGPQDGVYIRIALNRDKNFLAPWENILAVLEYTASSIQPFTRDMTKCWKSDGSMDLSDPACSSQTWQTYLKKNFAETVQSFIMLIPPTHSFVTASTPLGRTPIVSKQFYIPLAMDKELSIFQISRIRAVNDISNDSDFTKWCNPSLQQNRANNSALCMGTVFYSLTLYRM
ncbi:MAG: hypothetical protein HY072_05720, partial [Deltaproteobacteria bacterium]|nr:hypothetical protein [Deltaproteobacteria bacterium]